VKKRKKYGRQTPKSLDVSSPIIQSTLLGNGEPAENLRCTSPHIEASTFAPTVVPTTCDCTRQPSTAGELTIVALSAVSVLKYIWPQIAWAWDSLISLSVQKVLTRLSKGKKGRTKTSRSRGESRRIRRTDSFAAPVEGTCGKSASYFYTSTVNISSCYTSYSKLCSKGLYHG
jgi:hypothetical protein